MLFNWILHTMKGPEIKTELGLENVNITVSIHVMIGAT